MSGLREDQISTQFGCRFDQNKANNSGKEYQDDEMYKLPFRHLSDWYLLKENKKTFRLSEMRRQPLPDNCKFTIDYTLHGLLLPSDSSKGQKPIRVSIPKLKCWVIDRSTEFRGIWIESRKAWYQLKNPDSTKPKLRVRVATGYGPGMPIDCCLQSQAEVHLRIRAKFALLSNIVDLLSEKYNGIMHNFMHIHAKRTPMDIHSLLSSEKKSSNNHGDFSLNKERHTSTDTEPFDLEWLKKSADFCKQHLLNYHPLLGINSAFMKGLDELIDNRSKCTAIEEENANYYLQCARVAEKRSMRTPSGDPLPTYSEDKVRPNRQIEIQIQRAAREAASNKKVNTSYVDKKSSAITAKHKSLPSDAENVASQKKTNKRQRRQILEEDSDNSDQENEGQEIDLVIIDEEEVLDPLKKKKRNSLTSHRVSGNQSSNKKEQIQLVKKSKIEALPNIVSRILQDVKNDDLNVLVSQGEALSKSNMAKAIVALSPYLTPTPTESYIRDAKYEIFSIKDEQIGDILESHILKTDILSQELMLLVVQSLRSSGKKAMKAMFKKNKSTHGMNVGGTVIFKKWLCFALNAIQERSFDERKKEQPKVEELVVIGIMNLICDFHVIKDSKQLSILKSKFSIDWQDIVENTLLFAAAYELKGMIESCERAKVHLSSIMNNDKSLIEKNDGDIINKKIDIDTSKKKIVQKRIEKNSKASPIQTIVIDVDDKETEDKNEKERLRRARMVRLLKAAQSRAGAAAGRNSKNQSTLPNKSELSSSYMSNTKFSQGNRSTWKSSNNESSSWGKQSSQSQSATLALSNSNSDLNESSKNNSKNTTLKSTWNCNQTSVTSMGWGKTKTPDNAGWSSKSEGTSSWTSTSKQGSGWGNSFSSISKKDISQDISDESNKTQNHAPHNNFKEKADFFDMAMDTGKDGTNKSSHNTLRQNTNNQKSWIPPDTIKNKHQSSDDNSWKQQTSVSLQVPKSNDEMSWRSSNKKQELSSDQWGENGHSKIVGNEGGNNGKIGHDRSRPQGEEYRDGEYRRERFPVNNNDFRGQNDDYRRQNDSVRNYSKNESTGEDKNFRTNRYERSDRDVRLDANLSNERSDIYKNKLGSRTGKDSNYSSFRNLKDDSLDEKRHSPSMQMKNYGDNESEDGEIEEMIVSSQQKARYKDKRVRQAWNSERESDDRNSGKRIENKRTKFNDGNFIDTPRNANIIENHNKVVPSIHAPKQSMGRGRGRGLTLPAWMTHGKSDKLGKNIQSKDGDNDSSNLVKASGASRPKEMIQIENSTLKVTQENGKGRQFQNSSLNSRFQKNKPDRISPYGKTSLENNTDSQRQYNMKNNFCDRSTGGGRGKSFGSEGRGRSPLKQNMPDPPFNATGRGRGRGRGRDLTLPAWMTKKQNNI